MADTLLPEGVHQRSMGGPERPLARPERPKSGQTQAESAAFRPGHLSLVDTLAAGKATKSSLKRSLRGPKLAGMVVIALFFGGLVGWAAVAPLASAAVALGVISPDGNRRTVQHLEGGIIAELLVQDGSRVQQGYPLVVLEDIQARSTYNMLRGRWRTLAATQARLTAEYGGAESITFPDALLAESHESEVADLLATQVDLFNSRRQAHESRKSILTQRIAQSREEINGLAAQIASQTAQLGLITREVQGVQHLFDLGLERLPRLLSLQRQQAEIMGQRGSNEALTARAHQSIGEAELQIIKLDMERLDELTNAINQVRAELFTVEEQLRAAQDVLQRIVITAPVAGTVVQLRYHTPGGVIGPTQPILDIVPQEDDLLIDARVNPNDIDSVRSGLPAQVRLTAYSRRYMPRIEGRVRDVSADALRDQTSGQPYFLARIEVNRGHLHDIAPNVEMVPGMPAEVLVMTGERTALEYLFRPLFDAVWRSLREQ